MRSFQSRAGIALAAAILAFGCSSGKRTDPPASQTGQLAAQALVTYSGVADVYVTLRSAKASYDRTLHLTNARADKSAQRSGLFQSVPASDDYTVYAAAAA